MESSALEGRAHNAWIDVRTAEVVGALQGAGLDSLLLKGPSLGRWLYGRDEPRRYSDIDLLVAPDDAPAARAVIEGLGYERDAPDIPLDAPHHDELWVRRSDSSYVELHRTIPGVRVRDDAAWSRLREGADSLELFGTRCLILSRPGRLLNVCLHQIHHQGLFGTAAEDLRRAIAQVEWTDWRAAADLAVALDAAPAFLAGLRTIEDGKDLAARLGMSAGPDGMVVLLESELSAGETSVALFARRLRELEGPGTKVRFVLHKLFPPVEYMRAWSRFYGRGTGFVAITGAYVKRLARVVPHLVRGLRAWRKSER